MFGLKMVVSRAISDPFHGPTHMLPLIMRQTPPNIYFSEYPFRRFARVREGQSPLLVLLCLFKSA